jgi:GNAT superfamily N-acetyltransferase
MIGPITIRKAIESDATTIHELHLRSVRQLCSRVYSQEIIDGWLKNRTPGGYLPGINRGEMYVAEISGKIVGFGHTIPGEIAAIYVEPAYARQGIGTKLMEHGVKMASVGASGSIKVESTLNARPFYEKCGFTLKREITLRRNDVDIPAYDMFRVIR